MKVNEILLFGVEYCVGMKKVASQTKQNATRRFGSLCQKGRRFAQND